MAAARIVPAVVLTAAGATVAVKDEEIEVLPVPRPASNLQVPKLAHQRRQPATVAVRDEGIAALPEQLPASNLQVPRVARRLRLEATVVLEQEVKAVRAVRAAIGAAAMPCESASKPRQARTSWA